MNGIEILQIKDVKYQKCECCERVKDIYYKIMIKDFEENKLIVGDLDFCKSCGENLNKLMGNELGADEEVVKEFKF